MKRDEIPLAFPCGADFGAMPEVDRGRLCASCKTIVRDLSSMGESEARAVLAERETSRLCVRYLYDAAGRVVFREREVAGAKIIPDYSLTRKAKARLRQAAMLVAPLVLFQACGGASAGFSDDSLGDAQAEAASGHQPADAAVVDAERDAGVVTTVDGGDASDAATRDGTTGDGGVVTSEDGGDASDGATKDASPD
jgi:hypothetical protein